jgi:hypothetical protein
LNGWLVFTNKAIVRGLDPVGRESPRMIIPDDSYESASKKHAELLGTLYLLGPGKTLENTVAPGTERDVPGNEKSVPAEDKTQKDAHRKPSSSIIHGTAKPTVAGCDERQWKRGKQGKDDASSCSRAEKKGGEQGKPTH